MTIVLVRHLWMLILQGVIAVLFWNLGPDLASYNLEK